MNKYMMAFGLLLLGLSFAKISFDPLALRTYEGTCCAYRATDSMLEGAYYSFYLYDGSCYSEDASISDMGRHISDLMFGDGVPGLQGTFFDMSETCAIDGPGSPECASAKQGYYSYASMVKSELVAAKMFYYGIARQALLDAKAPYECGTTRGNVLSINLESNALYRECLADPTGYSCFPGGAVITP